MNMENFWLIYDDYKILVESFFHENVDFNTIEDIKKESILTLNAYNEIFLVVMNTEHITPEKIQPLDGIVGQLLTRPLTKHVFPLIKDETFLPRENDVPTFQRLLHKSEINKILGFMANDETEFDTIKYMIVELFVTFIKLFHKCNQRFYTSETYEEVIKVLSISDLDKFNYLYEFPEGVSIRSQILKVYRDFHIFYPNHLMNNRLKHNKNKDFSN